MDLIYYLRNFYNSELITSPRFALHVQDFLDRTTSRNLNGQFDIILANTTPAYVNFFNLISGESTDKAIQKGKTMLVDNIVDQFKKKVQRDYPVITSVFYKDTPEYKEFFPNGLTEYDNITRANTEILMNRMIAAITNHQSGGINPTMLAAYNGIRTSYQSSHTAQAGKKSDVTTDKTQGGQARKALEQIMFANIHTLAAQFAADISQVKEFFNTSLLYYVGHEGQSELGVPHIIPLAENEMRNSGLSGIAGLSARIINPGPGKLKVFTVSSLQNITIPPQAVTIDAFGDITVDLTEIGDKPDNKYLIIVNLDSITCSASVEIQGKVK